MAGLSDEGPDNDAGFEVLLSRLEAVVERLERENLRLDDALAAYEEGVALVRQCNDLLDRAELRIEELSAAIGPSAPGYAAGQDLSWQTWEADDDNEDDA